MDHDHRPWYRRLMTGLPPISDRAFALFFVALLLGLGMFLGWSFCFMIRMP